MPVNKMCIATHIRRERQKLMVNSIKMLATAVPQSFILLFLFPFFCYEFVFILVAFPIQLQCYVHILYLYVFFNSTSVNYNVVQYSLLLIPDFILCAAVLNIYNVHCAVAQCTPNSIAVGLFNSKHSLLWKRFAHTYKHNTTLIISLFPVPNWKPNYKWVLHSNVYLLVSIREDVGFCFDLQ